MERCEKVVEALLRYGDAKHVEFNGQGGILVTIEEPAFAELLASPKALAAYVKAQKAKRGDSPA